MRRYEHALFLLLLTLLLLSKTMQSEYWFQSGAKAGQSATYNNGASVQIQTVTQRSFSNGSMAFWVGEVLSNGAFIQMGYVIENATGSYPINCTELACTGRESLTAGKPTWFYEYFLPGNNSTFLGSLGPDGSAGANGTFNTYAFYSAGKTWYFLFNNKTVGSVDLGTSSSGPQFPVALGEMANVSDAKTYMSKVIFANLSFYKNGEFLPVSTAYGVVNYGVGSKKNIPNPYGVEEVGNRINYFAVGSGLPLANNTQLWSLGYKLSVVSKYGSINSGNTYVAYSSVGVSAPPIVYLNNLTRAVFEGWTGSGFGAYTGTMRNVSVTMNQNITETANWQIQYFVNVTSRYSMAEGTGWYANGSHATYGLSQGTIYENGTPRFRFVGWNNGNAVLNGNVIVNAPINLSAIWQYGVTLIGKNQYNQTLGLSSFVLDGRRTNSTPFLSFSQEHRLDGAYYKGVFLPLNLTITQDSPASFVAFLPVYNLSIKTTDLFSIPVNASVSIEYKNGTRMTMYSGASGSITIENVPYGYANVTLSYLGNEQTAIVRNGVVFAARFFSSINLIVLMVAFVWMLAMFTMRLKKKAKERSGGKEKKGT